MPAPSRLLIRATLPCLLVLVACTPAAVPVPVAAPTPAPVPTPTPIGIHASADAEGDFGTGHPVRITLHLRGADDTPLGPEGLQVVHTERLHVLGVDPSLLDYSHSHPRPLAPAGDWGFEFTPQHNRPYRLWLDLTPVGGKHEYVIVTLNEGAPGTAVDESTNASTHNGDIDATLAFDAPLVAGTMARGTLELSRNGRPLTALEPVMGTYGHIVGIGGDWRNISHVHPLGAEPHAPGDRGGPTLAFHLEPAQPGFMRLFAQVRVEGRDVYLPFGLRIASP